MEEIMAVKVYEKAAIISPEQLEAVDKVICFIMDNATAWGATSPDLQKALGILDAFVQEQW
jgi:hypothetical protein